jgi:cytidine deaminase
MRTIELSTKLTEYDSPAELPQHEQDLLSQAHQAAARAYAPYSNFYVGAALLLEDGIVVTGNNQENVAYPSGLCAERVAVFSASSQYPGVPVKVIAICCHARDFEVNEPLSPCGACRQVLAEYEINGKNDIRVLLMGQTGKILAVSSIRDLLPLVFRREELKRP